MSDDRELLELAAKAAGKVLAEKPFVHAYEAGVLTVDGIWSPLTDDGDALRLAVKLRFMVDQDGEQADVLLEGYVEGVEKMYSEPHGDDPCAATRRAIVRAAAAIGEAA